MLKFLSALIILLSTAACSTTRHPTKIEGYLQAEANATGLPIPITELNEIIEAARLKLSHEPFKNRSEALKNLKILSNLLRDRGYYPASQDLLIGALSKLNPTKKNLELLTDKQRKEFSQSGFKHFYVADCKTLSLIYLAVGEALKSPLAIAHAPAHTFIRFQTQDASWVNWETTSGEELSDDEYRNWFGISMPETSIKSGVFLKALSPAETDSLAFFNIGTYLMVNGDLKIAEQYLSRSIAIFPKDPIAYYNRAIIRESYTSGTSAALSDYNDAIELNPNYGEARINRAYLLMKMDRYKEAESEFGRILEIFPNIPNAHYGRGNARFELGQFNLAIEDYSRAIEVRKNYTLALGARADAYLQLKHYDLALRDINQALKSPINQAQHKRIRNEIQLRIQKIKR